MEGNECIICGHPITSERGVCLKTASCCGVIGQIHKQCAKKYYNAIYKENNDEFDLYKWSNSTSIQMFCQKCRVKCLFCKTKNHGLMNDSLKTVALKRRRDILDRLHVNFCKLCWQLSV